MYYVSAIIMIHFFVWVYMPNSEIHLFPLKFGFGVNIKNGTKDTREAFKLISRI